MIQQLRLKLRLMCWDIYHCSKSEYKATITGIFVGDLAKLMKLIINSNVVTNDFPFVSYAITLLYWMTILKLL